MDFQEVAKIQPTQCIINDDQNSTSSISTPLQLSSIPTASTTSTRLLLLRQKQVTIMTSIQALRTSVVSTINNQLSRTIPKQIDATTPNPKLHAKIIANNIDDTNNVVDNIIPNNNNDNIGDQSIVNFLQAKATKLQRFCRKHLFSTVNTISTDLPNEPLSQQSNMILVNEETFLSQSTLDHVEIEHQQKQLLNEKQYHQSTLDTIKQNENLPIGDPFTKLHPNSCRLYFQNINGAKKDGDWLQWTEANEFLNTASASIIGYAETNIKWNQKNINDAHISLKKCFQQSSISTSSSNDCSCQDYQPGGTATIITNNIVGHLQDKIQDNELGRWSGYRLKCKNNRKLYVITCYIPHEDTKYGTSTCFQQQWRLMRKNGVEDPNPRKQLFKDLTKEILEWTSDGSDLILMTDANETLGTSNNMLTQLLACTELTSLNQSCLSIPFTSYSRGHRCVDFIFGTQGISKHVTNQGYLPFYEGAWLSDHRGVFVDVDANSVFGLLSEATQQSNTRGVSSKDRKSIEKFLSHIHKDDSIDKLLLRITNLEKQQIWSQYHHTELEDIDVLFTSILTESDRKCIRKRKYLWSPELHKANQIVKYWTIKYKSHRNHINSNRKLQLLRQEINDDEALGFIMDQPEQSAHHNLKLALVTLDEIKRHDLKYREKYLTTKQEYYISIDKLKLASAVRQLLYSERSRRCFQAFKRLLRPSHATGGLSHILTLDEPPIKIAGKSKLDKALLKRNKLHFKQAYGTPFTMNELVDIFGYDGCTLQGEELLKLGILPEHLPSTVQKLLQELQRTRQPLSAHISFIEMIHGFNNWRESTKTSPSNKHLGIYKSLITADTLGIFSKKEQKLLLYNDNTNNTNTKPATFITSQSIIQQSVANKCLVIQHKLLNLAISHCHTYQRWKIVHNFFLEKLPGNPVINKLRVIHLYEADWNLLLKFFIAHKLVKASHKGNTLRDEQAGGRPGKSADSTATKTVITLEICRLQRLTGAIMYNDAKSCYDRIVENLSNLCCMREGLNPQIASLHSQTMREMQYYIKTKNGISIEFNKNSFDTPIFGTGQGSGDSGARWGYISDTLIRAYNKYSHPVTILGPISSSLIDEKILAFVDDTRLLIITPKHNEHRIAAYLQQDTQLWEQLLNASGGQLELGKCKFTVFQWEFDQNGTAKLSNEALQQIQLNIIDSETNKNISISQISVNTEYKLLGVNIAANGCSTQQEIDLINKCNKFESAFALVNLHKRDIELAYKCILVPAIRYALPATSIKRKTLNNIQTKLVNTILPKLGFNRHFPRAIVYASEAFGGLGIQDLATEQGIAHINMMMTQIRAKTTLGTLFYTLIESYLICIGSTISPFIDTAERKYIISPWIDTTKELLYTANATIILHKLQCPITIRNNDRTLMSDAITLGYSTEDLILINNCRLFLQVTTLAEICNDMGSHLIPYAMYGQLDSNNKPMLWTITTSKMIWPTQINPSHLAWKKWRTFLQSYTKPGSCLQLKNALGGWLFSCHKQRNWQYYLSKGLMLRKRESEGYSLYLETSKGHQNKRNYISQNAYYTATIHERSLPFTPTITSTTSIIIQYTRNHNQYMEYEQRPLTWSHSILHRQSKYQTNFSINKMIQAPIIYLKYEVNTKYVTSFGWSISDTNEILLAGNALIPPAAKDSELRVNTYAALCILYTYKNFMMYHQCPIPPTKIVLQIGSTKLYSLLREKQMYFSQPPSKCMEAEYENINAIMNEMEPQSKYQLQLRSRNQINDSQICTNLASIRHKRHKGDSSIQHHNHIDHQIVTLLINNIEINCNAKNEIRNAITSQDIRCYFVNKYNWKNNVTDLIDWDIHSKALSHLRGSMRKTIRQFIHEWLPLNGHAGTGKSESSKLCPRCLNHIETPNHFLSCSATQATNIWNEELLELELFMKQSTDSTLMKVYIHALEHWNTNTDLEYPTFLSPQYKSLFYKQKAIGWNQVVKGRLCFQWVQLHDKYMIAQGQKPNGVQYFQRLIQRTWKIIHNLWKERCNCQHNKESQQADTYLVTHYHQRVHTLYKQRHEVDLCDQKLFDRPKEEILQLPMYQIKKWLECNEQFIKDAIKRANIRAKMSTRGIASYFPIIANISRTKSAPKTSRAISKSTTKSSQIFPVISSASDIHAHKRKGAQSLITSHLLKIQSKLNLNPPLLTVPIDLMRKPILPNGNNDNAQYRPP